MPNQDHMDLLIRGVDAVKHNNSRNNRTAGTLFYERATALSHRSLTPSPLHQAFRSMSLCLVAVIPEHSSSGVIT